MYKPRIIKFKEIIAIDNWNIKTYTISKNENFESISTYKSALTVLPDWLSKMNSFDSSHENTAFLIVHEGTEGVFSLINTWVGNNMLQTHTFISDYKHPQSFKMISGDGLFACIWELEVIDHERGAWIKYVIKNPENPDYQSYLEDTITKVI